MKTLVIIRQNNYWGKGKSLAEAKANYKKASGRTPTSAANVLTMEGPSEDLERVSVDDIDGGILRPKSVQIIK